MSYTHMVKSLHVWVWPCGEKPIGESLDTIHAKCNLLKTKHLRFHANYVGVVTYVVKNLHVARCPRCKSGAGRKADKSVGFCLRVKAYRCR